MYNFMQFGLSQDKTWKKAATQLEWKEKNATLFTEIYRTLHQNCFPHPNLDFYVQIRALRYTMLHEFQAQTNSQDAPNIQGVATASCQKAGVQMRGRSTKLTHTDVIHFKQIILRTQTNHQRENNELPEEI